MADVVLQTLACVWLSLEALQLPRALMGGLSVAFWKHPRATRDVDLLVDFGSADPELVLRSLEQTGFRRKRSNALLHVGPHRFMQLTYQPPGAAVEVPVDLLLAESEYQKQALARRVPARLPDEEVEIAVLSCEDLILHKLLAGRILDRGDVISLLPVNRATLDLAYIRDWVNRLGVTREWTECWQQAFPGEAGNEP